MSVFDSRCAAVGPTLGIRFNGEPVEVAYTDGTRLSSTAIIEQEEPIRDTEMSRPTIRQAKVHFLATERNRLFPDKRRPTKLLAQGAEWYIVDVSAPEGGMFEVFVQDELADQSMAVDLQGYQHEIR